MKKTIRLFALTLACVMLCVPLMGCNKMLKDLQARSATKLDNGNFLVDGEEYILLPDGDYRLNWCDERILYLNDESFPTLLQSMEVAFGKLFHLLYLANDGRLLYHTEYDENGAETYYNYCRSDIYDSVIQQINDGIEYPLYGYDYLSGTLDVEVYYLTEEEAALIEETVSTAEEQKISNLDDTPYDDYESYVYLFIYSQDKLFEDFSYYLCKDGETYFLRRYYNYTSKVYDVPKELTPAFEKLFDGACQRKADTPTY